MNKIIESGVCRLGDPFILAENGTYYMYATTARTEKHGLQTGFDVHIAEKLEGPWTNAGGCLETVSWSADLFWAPEVYKRGGKYYMFFTTRHKDTKKLQIAAAIADNPLGPFTDLGRPLFATDYSVIDSSVYFEGNDAWLYYVKDVSDNVIDGVHVSQIYCVRLAPSLTEVTGEHKLLTTPDTEWETSLDPKWQWNEGPFVFKHENKYYLSYSVNCYNNPLYSVCYAVSDNPDGPFIKAAENPILMKTDEISGPGHNMYFTDFDGNFMTAYHVHTDKDRPSGDRRACFSRAFIKDGKLVIDYK